MTAAAICTRILKRLDDDVTSPGSVAPDPSGGPAAPELLAAVNEGQELFSLLTLCLEATAPLTLAAGMTFATIRATLPDFLVPLRLMVGGTRVRPATLAELDALNNDWQTTPGTPTRYFTQGFSFYGVTPQPVDDITASLTYARSPVQLVGDAFPEIPERFHGSALVNYGIYKAKLKEGAQGLERGLKYWNAFLDDAQDHADFVRARSRAARYDSTPFELSLADRARFLPPKFKYVKPAA